MSSDAPAGETHRAQALDAVLTVVREVLGNPGIRAEDNFFDAGGSSLAVIGMIKLLRERGWQLTARQIIVNPNISAIARACRAAELLDRQDTLEAEGLEHGRHVGEAGSAQDFAVGLA